MKLCLKATFKVPIIQYWTIYGKFQKLFNLILHFYRCSSKIINNFNSICMTKSIWFTFHFLICFKKVLQLCVRPQRHRRQRRSSEFRDVSPRLSESPSRRKIEFASTRKIGLGPNCDRSHLGLEWAAFSRRFHQTVAEFDDIGRRWSSATSRRFEVARRFRRFAFRSRRSRRRCSRCSNVGSRCSSTRRRRNSVHRFLEEWRFGWRAEHQHRQNSHVRFCRW